MTASSALLKEIKRQRLQTLARAFTEKNFLAVKLGSVSFTDLSEIEITDCIDEIIPGVPATPAECWVALKAMDAHESGHILFTAAGAMEEAGKRGGPLLQHILNVLEDARIERAMANAYPGTLNWFRFTNEYIYRNRRDWGEGARAFLWGLCSYALVGKVPDALDPETKDLVEKCKPFVDDARLAQDTWEVFDRAEKVHALAKDAFPTPSLPPVAMAGTDSPREAPQGPLDPRRVPAKRRKQRENDSSPEEPQENKVGGQTDGEGDWENAGSDNSGNFEEDGSFGENRGEEPGGDDAEPGEQNSPGSEEDAGEETDSNPGKDGGSGDTDAGAGDKDSSNGDTDTDTGDGEDGDGETDTGDNADDEKEEAGNADADSGDDDDGDAENGESSSSAGDSEDSGGDPSGWDDDEEDDGSGQDPDGSGESAGGQETDSRSSDEGDWDGESVAGGEPGDPEYSGDEDFSSLLEEAENEISRMASDAARQEKEAARNTAPEPDWSRIQEDVSKDLHQGCRFENMDVAARPNEYRNLVQFQQGLIHRLVEEIRKVLEYRPAIPRRNLKKGRLDAGSLWKLQVPDPQVFSRKEVPGDIPELAVYLLVDCSGSMTDPQYTSRGRSIKLKIDMAREAACALHEACTQLKITHCVVGFASNSPRTNLYRVVDWKEQGGDTIAALKGQNACNRDGYVIRVVARELELRPEPRKVLIVLSDGLPNDEKDGRYRLTQTRVPVADTAKAVRELERQGIGVIGIFFGNEGDLPQAQTIYNRLVYVQDVANLPVILGRVLKQVITQGA